MNPASSFGEQYADERSEGGHELDIEGIEIVGAVDPQRPFPITESAMLTEDEDGNMVWGIGIPPRPAPPLPSDIPCDNDAQIEKFTPLVRFTGTLKPRFY